MLITLLALPLVSALLGGLAPWRPWVSWAGAVATAGVLGVGVALAVRVVVHGPVLALDGILRADALSAFIVLVIGAVGLLASVTSVRYLVDQRNHGRTSARRAALYATLVPLFLAAMVLTVLAANIGVMWVGVEATTIVTTFLVGHRNTRGAVEASWKYVIICSVGIALAFFATVLVYLAARHAGGTTLTWTALMASSAHFNPAVMRLAFALAVLGYGTKVGLAPLHSWLPDAHSQSPAPVSALMSGVLLSVAFYALLRVRAIALGSVGPGFVRVILVSVGLVTLALAASMMLGQRDYKRLLAYSSMEHVSLFTLAAAAGTPLAMAAALYHVLGHGLTKGSLFLTSGELLEVEGTSRIDGVRALLARRPALGAVFALGLASLLGFPPFSIFLSELTMFRAESAVGLGWVVALTLVALAVVFVAFGSVARTMLFGAVDGGSPTAASPDATAPGAAPSRSRASAVAPLVVALVAVAAIGLVAWPLDSLLHAAAATVAP